LSHPPAQFAGPDQRRVPASRAFVQVIVGPVGSAKTVTGLRKLRRIGQQQLGPRDERGVTVRKARVGVIRESYPNLEKNTIPSWFRIHPESDGKFNWRAPFTHRLQLILKRDDDAVGRSTSANSRSSFARSATRASRKRAAAGK
jgi:hypothetical protein